MKDTTEQIIVDLKNHQMSSMRVAADRLKELQEYGEGLQSYAKFLEKERDEARAEVQRLKDHVPDATKMIRPEPSRLEIAAMMLQGMIARRDDWIFPEETALKKADALIAAAREGVK